MPYHNRIILKALRHNRGDSQTACAKRIGVTQRTITNWEREEGNWLGDKHMRLVYSAYHVTPQVADTIADQYVVAQGIKNAVLPPKEPETSKSPAVAAPQPTKPHTTNFLKYCLGYPNQVIGFGPKGHAMTIHAELDRLMRTNDIPDHHCDALIRYINGKRTKKGESLI